MNGDGDGDGGGGGGGGQHNRLATALITILVISLVLFFAQLFYVLWRRRRLFRRQTSAAGGGSHGDEGSRYSPSVSNFSTASSSKELLYFMSFRSPDFGLDANSATATATVTGYSNSTVSGLSDLNSDRQSDFEAIDIDLLKLYGKFARLPKNLSTIKENQEKQAAAEVPVEISLGPSEIEAEMEPEVAGTGAIPENSAAVVAEKEKEKEEMLDEGGVTDVITPFTTPCDSPVYLTPTASPVHEKSGFRPTTYPKLTST